MKPFRIFLFRRFSIRTVLSVAYGGLILLAVAAVLYIGLNHTTRLTKDYHQLMIDQALGKMTLEIEHLLIPAESQALWFSDQVKKGNLDIYDFKAVEAFIRATLGGTPHMAGAGIIYKDGVSRYLLRDQNIWIEEIETNADQTKVFLESVRDKKSATWSRLFWFDDLEQTIIDLRMPLYQNDQFAGVLIIGVTVAELSRSILTSSTDQFATPFVLYGDEHLLAHPLLTIGRTIPEELAEKADRLNAPYVIPLPRIDTFQDQKLNDLINGPVRSARLVSKTQGVEVNNLYINNEMHLVATRTMGRFGEIPWTMGIYINASKSEGTQAQKLLEMVGAGFLVLVISILISIKIGRKIARPITRLSDAAQQVRRGDLAQFIPLPRTRLLELDQAALAYNDMVKGLKERDLIREVFGRYVPESIAASLMKENGALEPTSTDATVLFCDLVGFTSLTQKVGPERIVRILNEYFSKIVEIIEAHHGVITQFQGDAILATFNVPVKHEKHADLALKAALEIRKMLADNTFDGVTLKARAGINSGPVVAGAVGAEGRLNYTVHGDTVNVASRIERLNKEFGSDILVSEITAELISENRLKPVGQTPVRGSRESLTLYVPQES